MLLASSASAVAENRGTGHRPAVRQIVERRVMRAQAIVPKGHVAELPAPAHGELRLGDMCEEEGKERVALLGRQLDDAEAFIDEQCAPSVLYLAYGQPDAQRAGWPRPPSPTLR